MSATEETRRLLDERGVEYTTNDSEHVKETCWPYMGELTAAFAEYDNGTTRFACDTWCFTPAQAIAATLGTGTCHLEEIDKDCDTASEYMLNREWCFDDVYRCSCGCRFGYAAHDRPRYCPNCGARVVTE